MTPEQIKAWQDQHGGLGENTPSPPDSKGLVTHRAADGAWMVVGPSGLVSYGPSPGVTAADAPGTGAPQPNGLMSDRQLQDWLDQHGGEAGRADKYGKTDDPGGAVDPNTNKTKQIDAVQSTTVKAADGATVTVKRPEGGGAGYVFVGNTPPVRAAATADPNTPAGRAAAAVATTDEIRAAQAQREAAEIAANAALPPDRDPRAETNAQRAERAQATIRQQGQDARAADADQRAKDAEARQVAVQNRPGAPTLHPDGKGGTIAVQTMPDGSIRTTPLAGVPSEAIPLYSDVKQDPASGKWYGLKKDGSAWAEIAGGPGTGSGINQGPALPQMVLGQSQAALRTYRDTLNSQVQAGTITPTIADKRWAEATQVAEIGIREATEQHNEEQSRRNADVNLRTNALSNSMTGFNSALDFVAKLNGSLPKGSTAGGEALAAILGLQQLQARRLGAFDNGFSGGAPRSAQTNQIDAATSSVIGTTDSPIGRLTQPQPAGAPASPPPPAGPTPTPTPTPSPDPAALGQGQDLSTPPAPPALTAPAPAGDPNELVTITSNTGATLQVPRRMVGDGPGQYGSAPERGGYQIASGGATAPAVNPSAGEPGHDPTAPVGMAPSPGSDFAVMQTLGNAPMPPAAPVPLGSPDPGPSAPPPALAHALAASKPPWQMSDDELQGYLNAGVPPEVVWGVPGRTAA